MNPFIFLLKPMMAAGLFVTKMLVAVGYVATENHDPAVEQQKFVEQVRVAVVPSDSGIESMEVEMPNGELFQLTAAQGDTDTAPRRSPGRQGLRPPRAARADVVAMLESTLGRTMRCDVALPDSSERGSAHCTVPPDETYDVVF